MRRPATSAHCVHRLARASRRGNSGGDRETAQRSETHRPFRISGVGFITQKAKRGPGSCSSKVRSSIECQCDARIVHSTGPIITAQLQQQVFFPGRIPYSTCTITNAPSIKYPSRSVLAGLATTTRSELPIPSIHLAIRHYSNAD